MATTTETIIHMLDRAGENSLCGAPLADVALPESEWDWTEEEDDITCTACKDENESQNEPCCGACAYGY